MNGMNFHAYQLTEFNLVSPILLERLGLIKIYRSDDGLLILTEDFTYEAIEPEKPFPATHARTDSVLGFVLDIGIQRKKMLTSGHGYYFGQELAPAQSTRGISQKDFDPELFERTVNAINAGYQSPDKQKELFSIRIQSLLDAYNSARLLLPNFPSDSYLGLMRIIDALSSSSPGEGALEFALFAAIVSPQINEEIYPKVVGHKERIDVALKLFDELHARAQASKRKRSTASQMQTLPDSGRFVFSCFFSAYQYRNKFVHAGFPFPDGIKMAYGLGENRGTEFFQPSLGTALLKIRRPTGLQHGDLIDIHEVVGKEGKEFKDRYFQLIPTWYFVKLITRAALQKGVASLGP